VRYAQTAESYGFEYALTQIRFTASYGAENQHESVSLSQALLHNTERIKLIAAILPGPWNPTVAAKQIASIDNYTNGRIAVNIVSGWNKSEFQSIGQWWLEHAERYRRSNEFIRALKGIWTAGEEGFSFGGDFVRELHMPCNGMIGVCANNMVPGSTNSGITSWRPNRFRNRTQRFSKAVTAMTHGTTAPRSAIGIS
jgi:alkanesulfonate monooxygenase SsuD/methylene tetrahydromethanopterin reductase-like flavin-dependent oxidoreductase (luciferase family)